MNGILLNAGDVYNDLVYTGQSINIQPSSHKKLSFKCKCGKVKEYNISSITNGCTRSCGECRDQIINWYYKNVDIIKHKSKFTINEFPTGGMTPLESIPNAYKCFKACCVICGRVYNPRLSDIRRGLSLTCGCTSNVISKPNRDIARYINKYGFETIFEYKVANRSFDIYVSGRNLLIEYDSEMYHKQINQMNRDIEKTKIAKNNGYNLLRITEENWKNKSLVYKIIDEALI